MTNESNGISGPSWIVVTGASRGLGAALCVGLAGHVAPKSIIVGMARSSDGLRETAEKVTKVNPDVKFIPVVVDLGSSSRENLSAILKGALTQGETVSSPKRALLIHNAGSLGRLDYLRDQQNLDHMNEYYRINVSSVVCLNALFLDFMRTRHSETSLEVVNISSLCAVQPFKSWALYCSGKAARDMLFRVLAAEEPNILVLNYAPGPLDNDMQVTARSATADDEVRSAFASMKAEQKLLPCEESVRKFLQLMDQKKFKSGDHVDYYDEL